MVVDFLNGDELSDYIIELRGEVVSLEKRLLGVDVTRDYLTQLKLVYISKYDDCLNDTDLIAYLGEYVGHLTDMCDMYGVDLK